MANLLSGRATAFPQFPQQYVLPPERRPPISGKIDIPIIDLHDVENSNKYIMKAIEDFGLFQVINHGVPKELLNEALNVFKEVFNLPPEERSKINMKEDLKAVCRIYTSTYNYDHEKFHYWRDVLKHHCNPLNECIHFWPKNPVKYREVVGEFVTAFKGLGAKILETIAEGIGLEKDYFAGGLSEDNILTVNHYPPCPDPSLTLGLVKHSDPNLITVLHSMPGIPGLELFKDGQWFSFDTIPDSLTIFIGNQLEVVSNGKLKAAVHRVSNANEGRISAAFFINPSDECIVEPSKKLLEAENNNPPLYKAFKYKDFFKAYTGHDGERHTILEDFGFKIK